LLRGTAAFTFELGENSDENHAIPRIRHPVVLYNRRRFADEDVCRATNVF